MKKREVLTAQLAQARSARHDEQVAFSRSFLRHPLLLSSPPISVIYGKVTEALRKHVGLDFLLLFFFSSPSPILSEICLFRISEIFRKHYGGPRTIFFKNWGRCFPPSSPRRASCLARKIPSAPPFFTKFTPLCCFLVILFS